jgi:signal peptidase I
VIVVFKTPADNRTDYIKRLIGHAWRYNSIYRCKSIYLNNSEILKSKVSKKQKFSVEIKLFDVHTFEEKLTKWKKSSYSLLKKFYLQNSDVV